MHPNHTLEPKEVQIIQSGLHVSCNQVQSGPHGSSMTRAFDQKDNPGQHIISRTSMPTNYYTYLHVYTHKKKGNITGINNSDYGMQLK
jgi:hypothetical protein